MQVSEGVCPLLIRTMTTESISTSQPVNPTVDVPLLIASQGVSAAGVAVIIAVTIISQGDKKDK